jgi:diguanylate cyclase (GGDEF)-like protein/PAS domain S-box-containing protein
LRLIADNLPALISYIDADRVFRFNNIGYERWLGRPLSEITGLPVAEVYGEDAFAQIDPWLSRALAGEQVSFELMTTRLGHRFIHVTYVPDRDGEGKVWGAFGLIHDITGRKQIEDELRVLAEFDSLTGLSNRSRFRARLTEAIARSERSGKGMALVFMDLDRFKAINDTQGHEAGDLVLQEFARRVSSCVRLTDTVARLAGDEFVIILEDMQSASDAESVAAKVLAAMQPAFPASIGNLTLSTSIGIALRHPGELDGDALLRRADAALYRAKDAGRAQACVAD